SPYVFEICISHLSDLEQPEIIPLVNIFLNLSGRRSTVPHGKYDDMNPKKKTVRTLEKCENKYADWISFERSNDSSSYTYRLSTVLILAWFSRLDKRVVFKSQLKRVFDASDDAVNKVEWWWVPALVLHATQNLSPVSRIDFTLKAVTK
ncbi:6184_t:CDS:2, partial [Acaulospora colombiana]